MTGKYTKVAEKAMENEDYNLAMQQYSLAIEELEKKQVRNLNDNKNLIHALSSIAVCKARAAFYHSKGHSIEYLLAIEQGIERDITRVQQLCTSLKINKAIQKEINLKQEEAYGYLRNSFWNFGDDLIAIAMEVNPELGFEGRKQIYNNIKTCRLSYIQLTNKMDDLSIIQQKDEINCARISLAELYDWYSDLYFDRAEIQKVSDPESAILASKKAIKYNVKAVSAWLNLESDEDITYLHLGHLNLVHQLFELSHEQSCLDTILDYINLNLKHEFDLNTKIEVLGMRLYVALNKTSQDPALTQQLAQQLLSFTPPKDQTQLNYYFDLANKSVDKEYRAVPMVFSKESGIPVADKNNKQTQTTPSTKIRKGKRAFGTDLTNESKTECGNYDPSLFRVQKKATLINREEKTEDNLLLLAAVAFQ